MDALRFHGGRIDSAMQRFPDAPRPWLDLSTGINRDGWRPATPLAVDLQALPSVTALAGLNGAAAVAFGAPDVAITALPGTEMGLRMLGRIALPAPYHHVVPGYRTHGAALPGSVAISVDALGDVAAGGGTVLLANPNNPDGRILSPERLRDVAQTLGRRGGLLVIDEAYADAVPGVSVLPHLAGDASILVLRSLGKFFGLAGVRLGFACGPAAVVARIAEQAGSWPVSATAIAYGTAAYRDAAWIAATRVRIVEQALALDHVLLARGLVPVGECPLFRLVECEDGEALFGRLARAGILTRPFDDAPRWLRIGLPGDDAALARLDGALGGG